MAGLSDHELVGRFATRRGKHDEVAEAAFAVLVSRHGPMVLQVCRGARRPPRGRGRFPGDVPGAGKPRRVDSLEGYEVGSWLHGVALRVAYRVRRGSGVGTSTKREARRNEQERMSKTRPTALDEDLARVLQEEIGRLPEKFRAAVVLCYLEGLTHEVAATQLSCPVGTIRSRLATARESGSSGG